MLSTSRSFLSLAATGLGRFLSGLAKTLCKAACSQPSCEKWVFRLIVTGRFGIVTERFGKVTGDFGGT